MRSQEPDKDIFSALCCFVYDGLMELSLSLKRFLFLCFYSIRKGDACTGVPDRFRQKVAYSGARLCFYAR